MRYSYEFKLKCVELYRQGIWPETPEGANTENFRHRIRYWFRVEAEDGPVALKHPKHTRQWTPKEKLELVSKVLAGESIKSTAVSAGINSGTLYQWVQKYKVMGYNGLVNQKRGRPLKEKPMKKKMNINCPAPLNESEREELIRLRAENEYIKAENEVIKKEIALREEKQAAQLKAKKQRLLKNSGKKDTD